MPLYIPGGPLHDPYTFFKKPAVESGPFIEQFRDTAYNDLSLNGTTIEQFGDTIYNKPTPCTSILNHLHTSTVPLDSVLDNGWALMPKGGVAYAIRTSDPFRRLYYGIVTVSGITWNLNYLTLPSNTYNYYATWLTENKIVIYSTNLSQHFLGLYEWSGTSWTVLGTTTLTFVGGSGQVTCPIWRLTDTDIVLETETDRKIHYVRWNGTAWVLVGSSFGPLGAGSTTTSITALTPIRVALMRGGTLQAYDWNGSVWSPIGSSSTPFGAGYTFAVMAYSSLQQIVAYSYGSVSGNRFRLLEFNGSVWTTIGGNNITGPSASATRFPTTGFYGEDGSIYRSNFLIQYQGNNQVFYYGCKSDLLSNTTTVEQFGDTAYNNSVSVESGLTGEPSAYWRFEETSGTTAVSDTGSYHLTYATGVTLGSPSLLPAYPSTRSFTPGSNGGATITTSGLTPTSSGFAVEAWVRPTSVQSRSGVFVIPVIVRFINVSSATRFALRGIGSSSTTCKWEFFTCDGGWTVFLSRAQSTTNIILNNTYYVVGVMETDGSTKLYVNGVLDATGPPASIPSPLTHELTLGRIYQGGIMLNLEGRLDNSGIYNSTLSATQIQRQYNEGIGG